MFRKAERGAGRILILAQRHGGLNISLRLQHPLFFLLLAYVLYAALFIHQNGFTVNGERCYTLFDDAMVSMRYAKNLVEGNGLVWNAGGERVEGFTNPLWTLTMAVIHLFPFSIGKISLPVLVLSAVFLTLNLFIIWNISDILSGGERATGILAVFFTAFFYPLNHWSYLGMEVAPMTFFMSTSALLSLRSLRTGKTPKALYLLLSVGTFIRLDAAIPAFILILFLGAVDARNRKDHLLVGGGVLLATLALQSVLRLWYYGDILPNTYYLKMTGYPMLYRISRGAFVALQFLWRLSPLVLLLAASVFMFRRDRFVLVPALMFLGQLAYSVYVGGDAWEFWRESNRYVVIAMPMFFVLLSLSVHSIRQKIGEKFIGKSSRGRFFNAGLVVLIVLSFGLVNKRTGWSSLREAALLEKPFHVDTSTPASFGTR